MSANAQVFKEYLKNRQDAINSEKSEVLRISDLFNEKTFYRAFIKDILAAKKEVIIYSPFVTKFRADFFKSVFEKLKDKNIEIFIFTRPIEDYDTMFQPQIRRALEDCEKLGVNVFYLSGSIHEKVAVIDREILWEGSLNILSQRASREMMRRTADEPMAMQIISYLNLGSKIEEGYKSRYEKLCRSLNADSRQALKIKVRLFLLGLAIPTLIWWLFVSLKSMILWSQGISLFSAFVKLLNHS